MTSSSERPGPEAGADPFEWARRRGRTARSSLDPSSRAAASSGAVTALESLAELAAPVGSGRVALSIAVRGELDVTPASDSLRSRGWSVWLPTVTDADDLAFREWRAEDRLVPGRFAIPEPPDDGRRSVTARDLEVVVTPAVAVDGRGTRVGSGFGFYDRALAGREGPRPDRPTVVVVVFESQVVPDELPIRDWDVPADVVVTERRTVRTGRR